MAKAKQRKATYLPGTNETVKHPGDLVFGMYGEVFKVDENGKQQPYAGRSTLRTIFERRAA